MIFRLHPHRRRYIIFSLRCLARTGGAGNNNQLVVQGTPPGLLTTHDLAPTVGAITAPVAPTAVNTAIATSATFADLGGGSHTALSSGGTRPPRRAP